MTTLIRFYICDMIVNKRRLRRFEDEELNVIFQPVRGQKVGENCTRRNFVICNLQEMRCCILFRMCMERN